MQTVVDATMNDVGIVCVVDFTACRVEAGRVLAKKLNVLLGSVTGSSDGFGPFGGTTIEFFGFVLDFLVQTPKDR